MSVGRHESWTYTCRYHNIEVVDLFSYVGITFNSTLYLNTMASNQALKAKQALMSILYSLYNCGQLPHSVYFNIFGTKDLPIVLFGTEL